MSETNDKTAEKKESDKKAQDIINDLHKTVEGLEGQLRDGAAATEKIDAVLDSFKSSMDPGVVAIKKAAEGMKQTAKQLEGIKELMSKIKPGELKKILARK